MVKGHKRGMKGWGRGYTEGSGGKSSGGIGNGEPQRTLCLKMSHLEQRVCYSSGNPEEELLLTVRKEQYCMWYKYNPVCA